jgi:putative ABC transport system ATP-binding protein
MIKLRNIEKSYRTGAGETFVLRRIDVDIQEGDFVTIMGPSGAGKSTLLSILGMLDGDWRGEYWLYGQGVHSLKPRHRIELNKQYIGFVFQQYHLLDDLTVYENLEIPLSYRDVRRSERAGIVAEALDRFGMVAKKDLYPSQLSGGQQQLVAVARATIANPKLILADEPTGDLDRVSADAVLQLLGRLNREFNKTIVMVTHDPRAAQAARHVVTLDKGKLLRVEQNPDQPAAEPAKEA